LNKSTTTTTTTTTKKGNSFYCVPDNVWFKKYLINKNSLGTQVIHNWIIVEGYCIYGNYRLEIYMHLLDLTWNSCEKCNCAGPWQKSNLLPCNSGAALYCNQYIQGGKNRQALLALNVKTAAGNSFEWWFAIENLRETLTPVSHYGCNNIWLTDIIPWIENHDQLQHYMFMRMQI
jgi:hypothetical protein